MALSAKWTSEAKYQFQEILNYWDSRNKSSYYSEKLISLVDATVKSLSHFPEIGRKTSNKSIRLKVIRNYYVFYAFNDEELFVLGIVDMRRDPRYIKSFLE